MRKYVITACFGVAVILFSQGARAGTPDEIGAGSAKTATVAKPFKVYNPSVKFGQFSKDLELSAAQQKEIKPILNELDNKLLPFKKLTLQRRGKRGAPIVSEYYQKIRNKLDAGQLTKFNDMVAQGEITPFLQ
jgi:hypothetical protein